MWRGYPNPSGTEMKFNFSSPLSMGKVTDKYIRIEYEDGEYKTRPHPTPMSCLLPTLQTAKTRAPQTTPLNIKCKETLSFSV